MPKVPLIRTKDGFYKTRRLRAGDRYLANPIDAVVMVELRKVARPDYDAPVREALEQPQQVSEQVTAALALGELRAEAEALGVRIDRRWAEPRLRDEIAKAKAPPAAEPAPESVPEPVPAATLPSPSEPADGGPADAAQDLAVDDKPEPEPAAEAEVDAETVAAEHQTPADEHATPAETTSSSGLFSGGGWQR